MRVYVFALCLYGGYRILKKKIYIVSSLSHYMSYMY